ncbi:peroxiredoxin family protein [Glaciecola sp. SC05]|uniref:peroxiredoxin family protein n=1 Tax=Glaciecola sp. SC05 TaxID=1987355 RepID=UPI003528A45A
MKLLPILLMIMFSFVSNAQTNSEHNANYPDAPTWTLLTQSGEKVSYSDFKGKPLIITFWGTWCPYCKKLHPGLEKIRVKYAEQGLEILAISVNEPFGANPEAELKKRGIHFPTLVEGDDVALNDFEIMGTPSTIFISPNGKILGSTMESNPDDPRFEQVAQYLLGLPR